MKKLVIILILLLPLNASAQFKRRVCANGHVQYSKCPEENKKFTNKKLPQIRSFVPMQQNSTAEINRVSFKKLDSKFGLWKGYLKGNGEVALKLEILRNGDVYDTRFIGKVWISQNDKPTKFNFKSALPNGSDWSWRIVNL